MRFRAARQALDSATPTGYDRVTRRVGDRRTMGRGKRRRFAAGRRTEAEVVERERGRVRRIGRACHDGRTSPPSRA
jgi:hypothetical protein